MKELSAERLREILSYEPTTGLFTWKISTGNATVATTSGTRMKTGYIRIGIAGKCYPAHRLAWLYAHGSWPVMSLDHINGVKDDNRTVCRVTKIFTGIPLRKSGSQHLLT